MVATKIAESPHLNITTPLNLWIDVQIIINLSAGYKKILSAGVQLIIGTATPGSWEVAA
jgi:hypothetical protein